MEKIFDVEPGLPDSYTRGGTNIHQSLIDRRRIFNSLHDFTEDRGGVFVIRVNGIVRVKPPLPIEMVPDGSSAILIESFFPSINPSLIGRLDKLPEFGAGMTSGKTIFRPEDGTEVNGDLNLIRNPALGNTYERCWEFLFRCAQYVTDNPPCNPADLACEGLNNTVVSNSTATPTDDLMRKISDALGER